MFFRLIRKRAFLILFVLLALTALYVGLFLELHLKWILEKTAFEALGSEVNISSVDIDWWKSRVKIKKIEITDPEKPEQNFIEFGEVSSDYDFMELFTPSFISKEAEIRDISFHTKRRWAGRLLPKSKRLLIFKSLTADKLHKDFKAELDKNAYSDVFSFLKTQDLSQLKDKYKNKLESLKLSERLEKRIKSVKSKVNQLKDADKDPEIKELLAEAKKISLKQKSAIGALSTASAVLEVKKKYNKVKDKYKNLLKESKSEILTLEKEIKKSPQSFFEDLDFLQDSLDPSNLSPQKLSQSVLKDYFSLQLSQLSRVLAATQNKALSGVKEYTVLLPGKRDGYTDTSFSQIKLEKLKEEALKAKARDFYFIPKKIYPKFWFKKIKISSKARPQQDIDDVEGYIANLTDKPEFLSQPLELFIEGSSKKSGIGSFRLKAKVDQSSEVPKNIINLDVSDYLIQGLDLFSQKQSFIKIDKSNSRTGLKMEIQGEKLKVSLKQDFLRPLYNVGAEDKNVRLLLDTFKKEQPDLDLNLKVRGALKSPKVELSSNIGKVLYDITKKSLVKKAKGEVEKYKSLALTKLNSKLAPALKDLDLMDLNSDNYSQKIQEKLVLEIKKLETKSKEKLENKAKEKLKDLFKRF